MRITNHIFTIHDSNYFSSVIRHSNRESFYALWFLFCDSNKIDESNQNYASRHIMNTSCEVSKFKIKFTRSMPTLLFPWFKMIRGYDSWFVPITEIVHLHFVIPLFFSNMLSHGFFCSGFGSLKFLP